jgi:cytochrome c-type biogenesis protein CcmF
MGFAPFISWIKIDKLKFFKKTFPNILIVVISTILFFLFYKSFNLTGMFGIILSFWLIYNNLSIFYNKRTAHSYSMVLAHLGVGFLILGITCSSVWQTEKILKMSINNEVQLNQYNIIFKKVTEVKGSNYIAIQGAFEVYDKRKNMVIILRPENRFYPITNIFTTEASIHTNLLRDLYIVIGEGNKNEGWVVRLYHNPLVIWIWIGALLIFLGGIISMLTNIKKIKILRL